jgi:universal stress protein A
MNNVLPKTRLDSEIPDENGAPIKQIVVAVDLSPHSENTAAYAADFAKQFGASLTLVHVFETKPVTTFNAYQTSAEEKRHDTERRLVSLADRTRDLCPHCDILFGIGDPAAEVSRIALSLNADMIVTGSHHSGFLSRLLGLDQAPKILHRAHCPVLVYHPVLAGAV